MRSLLFGCLILVIACSPVLGAEGGLKLENLIEEAVKNNPDIHVSQARAKASEHRIPQATTLSDPMFMIGYENEGEGYLYTFNRELNGMPADSRWMFSLSQMLPYPGKLAIKGEMASRDAESLKFMVDAAKLNTAVRVKELYYNLALAYITIDLLRDRTAYFSRVEDAALTRYATGMAPQQEVLMAQTEKYMLLEREEMEQQKIKSLEAMLAAALGRDGSQPLGGRPEALSYEPYDHNLADLIRISYEKNPMIRNRGKMAEAAEAKVRMAKKEYYPDFTVTAGYIGRGADFPDMWNLTTAINIPIFYRTKQKEAVLEAEAGLLEAKKEVAAAKVMTSAGLRDNYAMLKTAENLMGLYRDGLIPKAYQDFELALAGYVTGKIEAITAINRLKALFEFEQLYWSQFVEREKAKARIEGIAGLIEFKTEAGEKK